MTALAGGAIGALLTALVAVFVWLFRVPGDVDEHDRLTCDRDEDLATWVADEKLWLDRERERIINELNARGLLHSGERLSQLAKAKERALTPIAIKSARLTALPRGWQGANASPTVSTDAGDGGR